MKIAVKINLLLIGVLIFSSCSKNDDTVDGDQSNIFENTELPTVEKTYTIVDTDVTDFYSNSSIISKPTLEEDYYGQDAN